MLNLSTLVPQVYLALPVVVTIGAVLKARRRDAVSPLRDTLFTLCAGAFAGWTLVLLYAHQFLVHGHMPASQYFIGAYWGAAVACALRLFNAALSWASGRVAPALPDGLPRNPLAALVGQLIRAAILFAICAPYLGGMMLSYRPKTVHPGDPVSLLGAKYQPVSFVSSDGLTLRGWWIPAARTSRTDDQNIAPDFGRRTVIVCHGFEGDKSTALRLARELAPNGFNVLAFDFRAHGQSDGQFTTFGDLERRDVLGAVHWVRTVHPAESQKIFGVGESLGAAALIAAAGEPGDGQSIDAIAVFSPYDRLSGVIEDFADTYSMRTGGWLAAHLALPMSGVQLGARLSRFAPEVDVDRLAPRPIFIIAGEGDSFVDFNRSREFYDEASQPKYAYWMRLGAEDVNRAADARAAKAVRVFFESARSIL